MRELDVARQAAEVGGAIVERYYRAEIVYRGKHLKESHNLVTDADLDAEKAIVTVIRDTFADHSILGEEAQAGDVDAEHLWIVDPLDGTNNFAHRIPHFAISIAYCHVGQVQCGVVYNPIRGDWYVAVRGRGATHNGQPATVSTANRLDQVLIGFGFYYDRGAMMEATLTAIRDLFRAQVHGVRRFGTASLDLCQVGCGQFGAFFEYQLAPWDFAAGRLFVEEAGGRVTTCAGQSVPWATTSLLASNGMLHEPVLDIVGPPYATLQRSG
jgi:myo-inositol-1(or 4)-monophosphatase